MKLAQFFLGQITLLIIAGVLGFLFGRQRRVETREIEKPAVSAKAEPTKAPVQKAEAVIAAPPIETVAPPSKYSSRLATLQAVADLNRVLSNKISVQMILGEALNPDFVALFGLSDCETKSLNNAIDKAKARLAELEAEHAQIEPGGPGKIMVTIPIFPKEGGLVLDEFMATIQSTLGEERYAYYNGISRFDAERSSAFGMFGLSQTVINIDESLGTSANSSMSFDQQSGGMITTMNTGSSYLKVRNAQLYQKLVDMGKIPADSKPAK